MGHVNILVTCASRLLGNVKLQYERWALPFPWEPQFGTPRAHSVHHGRSAGPRDGSVEPQFGTPLMHFLHHGPPGAICWPPRRLKGASSRHTPHALRASWTPGRPQQTPKTAQGNLRICVPRHARCSPWTSKGIQLAPKAARPPRDANMTRRRKSATISTDTLGNHTPEHQESKICTPVSPWGPAVTPALRAESIRRPPLAGGEQACEAFGCPRPPFPLPWGSRCRLRVGGGGVPTSSSKHSRGPQSLQRAPRRPKRALTERQDSPRERRDGPW